MHISEDRFQYGNNDIVIVLSLQLVKNNILTFIACIPLTQFKFKCYYVIFWIFFLLLFVSTGFLKFNSQKSSTIQECFHWRKHLNIRTEVRCWSCFYKTHEHDFDNIIFLQTGGFFLHHFLAQTSFEPNAYCVSIVFICSILNFCK